MRKRLFVVIGTSLAAVALLGASSAQDQEKPLTAMMAGASFLVGTWEGEGWMMTQQGRSESTVREVITPKAGGTVLSLEGLGKDKATGKVVHEAFGVLFYDGQTKAHRMRSFVSTGQGGEFPSTITEGVIVWEINAGGREIKYTIKLDDKGRWFEIGEVKLEGDRWMQFFEMTLSKVKP